MCFLTKGKSKTSKACQRLCAILPLYSEWKIALYVLCDYLSWGFWLSLNKALAPASGYSHWSQQSSYLMFKTFNHVWGIYTWWKCRFRTADEPGCSNTQLNVHDYWFPEALLPKDYKHLWVSNELCQNVLPASQFLRIVACALTTGFTKFTEFEYHGSLGLPSTKWVIWKNTYPASALWPSSLDTAL